MKKIKTSIISLALCAMFAPGLQAQAPWFFGIGTGIGRLSSEGDQGFPTQLFGPVELAFDLSPDDVADLMKTAFGVGGYATNGTWMLQLSLGVLELGDEPSATLPGGAQVSADLSFEVFSSEFSLGYTAYRSPANGFAFRPHIGARLTRHTLAASLAITDGGNTTDVSRSIEESWTDFLVGTTFDIKLSDSVGWNTIVDAGFGGSDGTYRASTGLSWRAASWVSVGPKLSFMATDVELGSRGDADWYLYDANDFFWGLSVLFHF